MKKKNQTMQNIRVAIVSFLLIAVFAAPCWSASQVSGHYTSSSGKQISLAITVGSPPPQSLIVTQKLPAGTTIIKSRPPYKKLNKKTEAKWLLNGLKPGVITISMELDRPVKSGEIKATLRFRNRQTGKMTSLTIRD
jgi:hypothetical protein